MTTLTVKGMTCGHCKKAVEDALRNVAGVETVTVDLETGRAVVAGSAEPSTLVSAVEEEGYGASVQ